MDRSIPRLVLAFAPLLTGCAAPGGSGAVDAFPTFARDVAPLLYRHCTSCHQPGGTGPFSLRSYEDARRWAERIAAVTAERRMPPWLPSHGYGDFIGERRLSDAEIRAIGRWAASGAPSGDLDRAPDPPPLPPDGWRLGEPDLVLEFPAFQMPAVGDEVYRNLVVPASIAETRWVRAVEVRPGEGGVVHHARLMVDTTHSSAKLDAADSAPGFDGMDLVSGATNPEGFFVGWTPGKVTPPASAGLAWPLRPGSDLVLQLHLRPTGKPTEARARVGLYFADRQPARRPALIMLGSRNIHIPAGDRAHPIVDEYRLPVAVEVLGIYPHAHYLAKQMSGYATLPNGERQGLFLIENWDFDWQDEYRYTKAIPLPAGTVLTMHYVYDNSNGNPSNPHDPPRDVRYGSRSTDEMADLLLQVLPRSESDRLALESDLRLAMHAKMMAIEAREHESRGDALAAAGQLGAALAVYRESLRSSSEPRVMGSMARVLLETGEVAGAIIVAERAIAAGLADDPRLLEALARAYRASGRSEEAAVVARRAIEAARQAGLPLLADSIRARIASGHDDLDSVRH